MLKINFYLEKSSAKNLFCQLSSKANSVSFGLEHRIESVPWHNAGERLPYDDPYTQTFASLKKYLGKKFDDSAIRGNDDILSLLKNEITEIISSSGLEGLRSTMFAFRNQLDELPPLDKFIQAFEKHSGLSSNEYTFRDVENMVRFLTKDEEEFVLDTEWDLILDGDDLEDSTKFYIKPIEL